jgi:hypothetical protein
MLTYRSIVTAIIAIIRVVTLQPALALRLLQHHCHDEQKCIQEVLAKAENTGYTRNKIEAVPSTAAILTCCLNCSCVKSEVISFPQQDYNIIAL